jgi:hypothetical protein
MLVAIINVHVKPKYIEAFKLHLKTTPATVIKELGVIRLMYTNNQTSHPGLHC